MLPKRNRNDQAVVNCTNVINHKNLILHSNEINIIIHRDVAHCPELGPRT